MLLSASASVLLALCALLAAQEEAPPGTAPTEEVETPPAPPQPKEAPTQPPPPSHTQPLIQPTPAPAQPATDDRLTGHLSLEPRGVFIINVPYNTGTLTPGSFVFYAFPPAVSRSQFFISP